MADFFTIGHSNHSIEEFIRLLQKYEVTELADVRSRPMSRYSPQFNRYELRRALKVRGLAYVFLGKELGARPRDPSVYEWGRVRYDRLAHTSLFQSGIDRLISKNVSGTIALMCAEKDPIECHRTLLVGRALERRKFEVAHILANGSCETSEQAMSRLLAVHGLPEQDMFKSREQLLEQACAKQEQKVAFMDESTMEVMQRD